MLTLFLIVLDAAETVNGNMGYRFWFSQRSDAAKETVSGKRNPECSYHIAIEKRFEQAACILAFHTKRFTFLTQER